MAEKGTAQGQSGPNDRAGRPEPFRQAAPPRARLESWKEIAEYLGRDVRTVQRWERSSGMPVYRVMHEKHPTVYALAPELDAWLAKRTAGPLASTEPEPVVLPQAEAPARGPRLWILGVLLGIAVGTALWMLIPREKAVPQLRIPTPLTSDPGWEWGPQLSADGRSVAYTRGNQNIGPQVVVQLVGGGQLLEVAGPERNTYSPSWSSDGNSLALLRREPGNSDKSQLVVLPALGGTERKIAELLSPGAFQAFRPEPYLDWSADDRFVVACDRADKGDQHRLVLISVNSGEKRALTDGGGPTFGDYSPRFSPDGRHIAFSRVRAYGISKIFVLDLTSDMQPAGPLRSMPSDGLWNASPAWTPDGRRLMFLSGTIRNPRLSAVDVNGRRPPAPLPIADYGIGPFDLGKSGENQMRLVYTRFHQDEDIWKIPLAGARRAETAHSAEFVNVVNSSYSDIHPRCSPDGSKFVFVSNRTGDDELWMANADGSGPVQLTKLKAGRIGRPSWSPDGKRIAFELVSEDAPGIYEIASTGGEARMLVPGGTGEGHPDWSPDGQWLFFSSTKSGEDRIWKIPSHGGDRVPVLESKAGPPMLTPDGKGVVYTDENQAVFFQSFSGSSPVLIFSRVFSTESLEPASKGIYANTRVTTGSEMHQSLSFYSFADGKVHEILAYPKQATGGLTISRDGTYGLVSMREHITIDLMTVDGLDPASF